MEVGDTFASEKWSCNGPVLCTGSENVEREMEKRFKMSTYHFPDLAQCIELSK